MKSYNIACSLLLLSFSSIGQDSLNQEKLRRIVLAESIIYTGTMATLGFIWYGNEPQQSFTFFNDNNQWLQMDKVGHLYTAYHLSQTNALLLQNAGMSQKKALLWSGISSTVLMLPIEIFDGFSANYGASWGDALANTLGAFLPFQQLIWEENYLHPKYSFSPSNYAEIRPNTLGATLAEQWLKDYNGQTYWLSANLNLLSKNHVFPDWLAFSVGYSGREMIYGSPADNNLNGYNAQRQFFLSMDIDFSKFKTEKKWLKPILYVANLIKVPFPTLEIRGNQFYFHPLYF
jgi:hypothetical protein